MNRGMVRLALALVLAGCSDASGNADGHADALGGAAAPAHVHTDQLGGAPTASWQVTSESVYNLDGQWWDANGADAPLARLGGRPQVVALVYTSCAQACPAIVAELKRVEAALGPDAERVGFVLASIDPARDTPEKLAVFATRARLDPARWTLLGAPEATVLELAAVLGVQYRALPDGDFAHANVLTLLDRNGEVVHRQLGLGAGTAATVAAARRLLSPDV